MKKLIKNKIRRLKYLIKWNFQFYSNNIEAYRNINELKFDKNFKPLVLVPHADDEWIGNSEVLQNSDSTVYYFQFLGNNYSEANKQVRLNELLMLKNKINFKMIISNDYEDYSDLEVLLSESNFTDVFIPFPIDWHNEHIKVNTIFYKILLKVNQNMKLHFYHISVPLPIDLNIEYLPISKSKLALKKKIYSKIYKSQYNTPIARLSTQRRMNAKGTGYYASENYAELSFEEWTDLLKFVEENYSTKIKPLIHYIDDLALIREKCNQVYLDWKLNK